MPDHNDYIDRLYSARSRMLGNEMRDIETRLLASYANEMQRIIDDLRNGRIAQEGAEQMLRQIRGAIMRIQGRSSDQVKRAAISLIDQVGEVHGEALRQLQQDLDVQLSYSFDGFSTDAYEGMFVRRDLDIVNTFKTLDKWTATNQRAINNIEDAIRDGLARGKSWRQVQQEIARALAFGNENVQQLLNKMQSGQFTLDDILRGADINLKGLMFDARRIAVTEIDVALHEGERIAAMRNPVIEGLRWKTSGRHATLRSSPDICDVFEQGDLNGLGEGVFYPSIIPAKPHPFCGCTRLYELRPASEWGKDKPNPREPKQITASEVVQILNANMRSNSRSITPRLVSYTVAQANKYNQLAFQIYKRQTEAA